MLVEKEREVVAACEPIPNDDPYLRFEQSFDETDDTNESSILDPDLANTSTDSSLSMPSAASTPLRSYNVQFPDVSPLRGAAKLHWDMGHSAGRDAASIKARDEVREYKRKFHKVIKMYMAEREKNRQTLAASRPRFVVARTRWKSNAFTDLYHAEDAQDAQEDAEDELDPDYTDDGSESSAYESDHSSIHGADDSEIEDFMISSDLAPEGELDREYESLRRFNESCRSPPLATSTQEALFLSATQPYEEEDEAQVDDAPLEEAEPIMQQGDPFLTTSMQQPLSPPTIQEPPELPEPVAHSIPPSSPPPNCLSSQVSYTCSEGSLYDPSSPFSMS